MTKSEMSYLDTINHPKFREAGLKVYEALKCLQAMGLPHSEAYGWIDVWASGAGDGDGGDGDVTTIDTTVSLPV